MFDRNKSNRPENAERTQADKTSTPEPVKPSSPSSVASTNTTPARSGGESASGAAGATIGTTIRIKGDVSGDENLMVAGTVEGTISLPAHELTVGKSGKVVADLTAKTIRVHGEVQGDITGKENVIISSTSNVKGNIVTPRMTLEDGARFKGSIDIDPSAAGKTTSSHDFSSSNRSDNKTGSLPHTKNG